MTNLDHCQLAIKRDQTNYLLTCWVIHDKVAALKRRSSHKKDCKSENLSSGSMSMLSEKPYYAWLAVAAKEKNSLINALGGTGMAV
jgi:hypothetical protein